MCKTAQVLDWAQVGVQEANVSGGGVSALLVAGVEGLTSIVDQINMVSHPRCTNVGTRLKVANQN